MKSGAVVNDDGDAIIPHVWLANRPWTRLRGLLFRPPLASDEGLWISPCGSVHTLGMRYAIDVVFLDRAQRIVRIVAALAPRRTASARTARSTLELPAGAAGRLGLRPGDRLTLTVAA